MTEERESAKKKDLQGVTQGEPNDSEAEASIATIIVTSAVALVSAIVATAATPEVAIGAAALAVGAGVTAAVKVCILIWGD